MRALKLINLKATCPKSDSVRTHPGQTWLYSSSHVKYQPVWQKAERTHGLSFFLIPRTSIQVSPTLPPSPWLCRSLLGGDEKAFEESHSESQSRKPVTTTGCRSEGRHSRGPVTSGTLRMRGRPLEAAPVSSAHVLSAQGARQRARQHLNLPLGLRGLLQGGLSCARADLCADIYSFIYFGCC